MPRSVKNLPVTAGLFPDTGQPRFARLRYPSACHSYPGAGISASLGQTSSDRKLDDANLAVRFRHRRPRLPDALSLVSAAESCTAALNVV